MAMEATTKEVLTSNDADRAIILTGSRTIQLHITVVCGCCFMAAAFQSGLNSFVLPVARCDLQMDSEQMATLNVAFMLGSIASSFLWGAVADLYGRKKVLVLTFLLDAALTVASSFSPSYVVFLTFRFLNGFVIGAPCSLIIPYLGEFHTSKQGTISSCAAGFFWTLGWMLLPGLAWLIVPMEWNFNIVGIEYHSWRVFVATLSLPCLLAALVLCFYPESPKYLLSRGKLDEAMLVLREMYSSNMRRPPDEYPVLFVQLTAPDVENANLSTVATKPVSKDLKPTENLIYVLWKQTVIISTPPVLRNTLLGSGLLFTNMFGFYGLGLWLPEVFNRFQEYYQHFPEESSISVCELHVLLEPLSAGENGTSVDVSSGGCNGASIDPTVFMNTFTVGAVCLLGNVLSGLLAGRFRRWVMPVSTMMIAGLSALSIYFVNNATGVLIVSCIFQAAISSANFVISGNLVEDFPTNVRAQAVCTCIVAGRIGSIVSNIVIGELIDVACAVPIILVPGVVIAGGFLALLTPSSSGSPRDKEQVCEAGWNNVVVE